MAHSKLEGRVTVPAGGWDVALTDQDAGPTTVTLAAGDYYLSGTSGLIATLLTAINTAMGQTWTLSLDAGADGTGKVTIGCGGATCTIAWTDTDLRDLLGFAGNLSAATSYVGTLHARSLWLPDCPTNSPYGSLDHGRTETDARGVESPGGHVAVVYSQRKSIQSLSWDGVAHAKARLTGEDVAHESFERFWVDVLLSESAWTLTPGGPIRFYPDADTDTVFALYKVPKLEEFETVAVRDGWIGLWQIRLERLVLQGGAGGGGPGGGGYAYAQL